MLTLNDRSVPLTLCSDYEPPGASLSVSCRAAPRNLSFPSLRSATFLSLPPAPSARPHPQVPSEDAHLERAPAPRCTSRPQPGYRSLAPVRNISPSRRPVG